MNLDHKTVHNGRHLAPQTCHPRASYWGVIAFHLAKRSPGKSVIDKGHVARGKWTLSARIRMHTATARGALALVSRHMFEHWPTISSGRWSICKTGLYSLFHSTMKPCAEQECLDAARSVA